MTKKLYQQPDIVEYRPIEFETAQSWNSGRGNLNHPGHGSDPGPKGADPGRGTDGPPGHGHRHG